jgi:hypothetical protein
MSLEKVKKDIVDRSFVNNFKPMKSSSKNQQEYAYRYCKSSLDELKDYYIVVSNYLKYKGSSMEDFGFNVYVYDKDGNYINNPELQEKCKESINTFNDI